MHNQQQPSSTSFLHPTHTHSLSLSLLTSLAHWRGCCRRRCSCCWEVRFTAAFRVGESSHSFIPATMTSPQDVAVSALKLGTQPLFASKAKLVTHVDKDKRKDVVVALNDSTLHVIVPKGAKVDSSWHVMDIVTLNLTKHNGEEVSRLAVVAILLPLCFSSFPLPCACCMTH